ncbi:MAG: response regulator [Candidatus Zixiibacteriota bacterium]
MAPLMAYPEFIRNQLPPGNKVHKYIDSIEKAAEKIADINQDLLTMGRRGHYAQEVIDLNQVVLQVAEEIELQTKSVTCVMELCPDLMKIKGGSAQIHRTLTNLQINARDAMQDAGQIIFKTENYYANDTSVAFGRIPMGEYVKLTISDTGCGISDDIIQKILDPFFSTKEADRKQGSGLGLSVVDAVMKDHNGFLDIYSKVGQGTSFYLYFPITREIVGRNDTRSVAGGTEKILIVDDDTIQRDVSSHLLKRLGYMSSSVESGEKAIEFLRENPQDLVILDMVMQGGIDGTETYRQILKINPHQKAIILSGYSGSDRVLEAQKLGVGAFIKKPITKDILAAAIRKELDRPVKEFTA